MSEIIKSIEEIKRPIRYVFFDLGDVVFSFSGGLEAIAKKVGRPLEDISAYWRSQDDAICRGELNPQQFWINLASKFRSSDVGLDFLKFWVSHFRPIQQTHDTMQALQENGMQIGILTNIYPGVFEKAMEVGAIPSLDYHVVVKSCDLGVVKPDLQIFRHAIQQANCPTSEVVLIDDLAENIQAVESLGWNALLFNKGVN